MYAVFNLLFLPGFCSPLLFALVVAILHVYCLFATLVRLFIVLLVWLIFCLVGLFSYFQLAIFFV